MSRFPFPRYPNGWFRIAYSDEVANGAVLPLKYFGKDLVLFRGETGELSVLDAHCAHMGAHLGHGGKVKGNCIECPFHAWKFDGTGACVEIPYAKKIPAKAKVQPWTIQEKNGLILAWSHMRGDAPVWEIPSITEYANEEWTPYERRRWKIRTHNQEMAENAVDSAHFRYVHGTLEMPTSRAEAVGHILRVSSDTMMKTPMGKTTGTVTSESHGFGYAVTRFTGIVDTLLLGCVTPIDEDYVDVRFSFSVKKLLNGDITSTVGQAFIREIERQLGQDIPIWENKIYVNPPLLCDGDGPVALFRRWSKQFYEPRGLDMAPQETAAAESPVASA